MLNSPYLPKMSEKNVLDETARAQIPKVNNGGFLYSFLK